MKIILDGINLLPSDNESKLPDIIGELYGEKPVSLSIIKKSLDCRKKHNIHYSYRVLAELSDSKGKALLSQKKALPCEEQARQAKPAAKKGLAVTIAGCGPAGLFACLRLCEAGASVTLIERGKKIEERMRDIELLEESGTLDPESNVLFGEGGAGTYSDGKLTSRSDRGEAGYFFDQMLRFGAPEEILYDSKPHVGTDLIREVVRKIRLYCENLGAKFIFGEKMTALIINNGSVAGIRTSGGMEILSHALILATGHSGRDTYKLLEECGVSMEPKPFALGVRVEHPRELIDSIQYGKGPDRYRLPAAVYSLAFNNRESGRGTYSFCMCPGGAVVNSSSEHGLLCVNGMSYSARDLPHSNSALVVTVRPEDYPQSGPLGGIALQRQVEAAAYSSGGGNYTAPAARITSFLKGELDRSLPAASYRPGTCPAMLDRYLPAFVVSELKLAIRRFNQLMPGFVTEEAALIGAETRTSSPVRIIRNSGFESVSHRGLFPAGEGAGYAGGIVSSAVDGVRAADAVIRLNP